jgi:hypothetical protein
MEYEYNEYNVFNLGNKFLPTDGWYTTALGPEITQITSKIKKQV